MATPLSVSPLAVERHAPQLIAEKGSSSTPKTLNAPGKSQPSIGRQAGLRTSKKAVIKDPYLAHLLEMQQVLQERIAGPVTCATPVLMQDGEGIMWPHTINLIQGQTGTHKSRVAELISSFLIAEGDFRGEALGLALGSPAGPPYSVCYVDTERNQQEQLILAMQQMLGRAGYAHTEQLERFRCNSLLDIPRPERLAALRAYLEYIRREMSGHLIIVLDQLADCVADFNDPKESMLLTDLLNVMVNQQDVTFLCVIHENPGGSKARGHLGTEMANKASVVLQVGFLKAANGSPGDVLQLKYLKRRSGAPNLRLHVQYDAEKGELVRAEKELIKAAIDGRKQAALPSDIVAHLGAILTSPLPLTDLKSQLKGKLGGCSKTLGKRLAELIAERTPVPDADGVPCILQGQKQGTRLLCHLEPLP